eukprot:Hpha_TRINITY_DN14841_c0_g1::TRINITY_DN14841_c0_g1_i1::g.169165::m.169165/K14847/RPF2; ribosome production factor 2
MVKGASKKPNAASATSATAGGFVRRPPKTRRGATAQKKMAPMTVENPRSALFMRGESSSQLVQNVLTDLHVLKKPNSKRFHKKNEFRPFETTQHLEFLAFKNDASLFGFGTHSKKRPHNLTLGRHFDYSLLDMVELGVMKYDGIKAAAARIAPGSKPLMVFIGDAWESVGPMQRVQNVFVDFFRGRVVKEINLAGLDRVICVTARPTVSGQEITSGEDGQVKNATLLFRHYSLRLRKSGDKVPRVELVDAGPTLDLEVRRLQLAPVERFRLACKMPKGEASRLRRELRMDKLGNEYGQVHVGKQNAELGKLGTRNFKAFKVKRQNAAAEAKAEAKAGAAQKRAAVSVDDAGPVVQPRGGPKRRRKAGPGGSSFAAPDDAM